MSELPTPPATASVSAGARSRRVENSDSSTSSVGRFAISNLNRRVITPPRRQPLCSFGRDSEECKTILRLFGTEFETKAFEILSEHGLAGEKTIQVSLEQRVFRDDPCDTQPAIYIVAKWDENSPRVWQLVVETLKKFIDKRVLETEAKDVDISVEMVAEELTWEKYISLIPNNASTNKLRGDWPVIKEGVFAILQSFDSTRDRMTAISLFEYGHQRHGPNPRTVYVSVDYDSPEIAWPPVVRRLQAYLDQFHHDLYVLLEHNTVDHSAFRLLPTGLTWDEKRDRIRDFNYGSSESYSTEANAGAEIGPSCYLTRTDGKEVNPGVGTLGCWVKVQVAGKGWKTLALTSYHVIRPALDGFRLDVVQQQSVVGTPREGSALKKTDRKGLFPAQARQGACALIEHPARSKHNFAVECLNERLAAVPSDVAARTERDEKVAFFDGDKQHLGRLYFASGYGQRTSTNARLDWALIEPIDQERVGRNILPTRVDWKSKYIDPDFPMPSTFGKFLQQPAGSLHGSVQGERLFKIGSSTTCSVGEVSGFKPDCNIAEDKYLKLGKSTEVMVVGIRTISPQTNKSFSKHGDSGSVIWDKDGKALGLLFTGQTPQQSRDGHSLVTPIEDVFKSIKDLSKGKILDVQIAEP